MATYNRGNVLPYSIGSVLDQTFRDFELLVVGDGCTDESQSVVESFNDPRIRWFNLAQNSGHQSAPNNRGISESRGELIAYLGHDDLWLPHHLEVCCRAIEEGADLAYGITLLAGEKPGCDYLGPPPYWPGSWIPPSSVVHRRSIVQDVGEWKHYLEVPRAGPDRDFWRRIHEAGFHFSFVPRLSVVKIAAVKRQGVYIARSTHEQEHWQRRMRTESSFEVTALANCYFYLRDNPVFWGMRSYGTIARSFVFETLRRTRAALSRVRWQSENVIERNRRFKGLSAKPETTDKR